MNIRQRRRIKQKFQDILFSAVLVWMAASFLAAFPAMAMRPQAAPSILSEYERVETYRGYAYGLEGKHGSVAISTKGTDDQWMLLCKADKPMSGMDILRNCDVPIGIARHLRVLSHKGMAHDLVLPDV